MEAEGGSHFDSVGDELLPVPCRGRPPRRRSSSGSPRPPRPGVGQLNLVMRSAPSPVGEGGPSCRHRRGTQPPRDGSEVAAGEGGEGGPAVGEVWVAVSGAPLGLAEAMGLVGREKGQGGELLVGGYGKQILNWRILITKQNILF